MLVPLQALGLPELLVILLLLVVPLAILAALGAGGIYVYTQRKHGPAPGKQTAERDSEEQRATR